MHQPLMLVATSIVQVLCATVFSVGAAGTVVEDFQLHAWAVEIMSSAAVIGGGMTLIYARWQAAQINAAKQWQQVNAASLTARVKELEGALAAAKADNDKLDKASAGARTEAEGLRKDNLDLLKRLSELSSRMERHALEPSPPAVAPAAEGNAS